MLRYAVQAFPNIANMTSEQIEKEMEILLGTKNAPAPEAASLADKKKGVRWDGDEDTATIKPRFVPRVSKCLVEGPHVLLTAGCTLFV